MTSLTLRLVQEPTVGFIEKNLGHRIKWKLAGVLDLIEEGSISMCDLEVSKNMKARLC